MKAIQVNCQITSIRSKTDRSLGLSVNTCELTNEQKMEFLNLQGINLIAYFKPLEGATDLLTVPTTIDGKTPSQRLRHAIFLLYTRTTKTESFEVYYEQTMNTLIAQFQRQLEGI